MSQRSNAVRFPKARTWSLALSCWALGVVTGCSPNAPATGGSGGSSTAATGGSGTTSGTGGTAGAAGAGGSSPSSGSGGSAGTGGVTGAGGTVSGAGGRQAGAGGNTGGTSGNGGGGGTSSPGSDASPSTDSTPVSSDAPPSSASSDCTASKAKFCDDFDKQTAGMEPKGPFAIKKSGGTMLIDAMKPYSGTQSLHIHFDNATSGSRAQLSFVKPAIAFPFAANTIHGRMMLFTSRVPTVHWDLVTGFATDAPVDNDNILQYILGSMFGNFMAVHQGAPAVDDSVDSATKFPVGVWACIQWEFRGAMDGTHHLRMLMDGKLVDKGDVTKATWKPPTFNSLAIGPIHFQSSTGPVDMFIDDLAFGEQEIACPPAK